MGKGRIWELDALRGVCIIGMVIVHFLFDLGDLFGLIRMEYSGLFSLVMDWGGTVFVLISGICATLGSRCVRRGVIILGCGMLVSAATALMYLLGMTDAGIIIYFGVLHCLGACMLGWHFLRKLPTRALAVLSAAMIAAGFWIGRIRINTPLFIWLGLITPTFTTSDYFPLLPYLGFFLLGAVLGRTLYRSKRSLLPKADLQNPAIRFCTAWGRHSLLIYLAHQPVLSLLIMLFTNL